MRPPRGLADLLVGRGVSWIWVAVPFLVIGGAITFGTQAQLGCIGVVMGAFVGLFIGFVFVLIHNVIDGYFTKREEDFAERTIEEAQRQAAVGPPPPEVAGAARLEAIDFEPVPEQPAFDPFERTGPAPVSPPTLAQRLGALETQASPEALEALEALEGEHPRDASISVTRARILRRLERLGEASIVASEAVHKAVLRNDSDHASDIVAEFLEVRSRISLEPSVAATVGAASTNPEVVAFCLETAELAELPGEEVDILRRRAAELKARS